MNKKIVSIILNFLLIILEIIGLYLTIKQTNRIGIEYYTEEANILALLSSLFFVFYMIKNKEIPNWLRLFKYTTTIGLSVTFLVVLIILAPMDSFKYSVYMLSGAMLYHHLLCPLIGIITFLFFDNLGKYNFKDNIIGLNLTFLYAIILIILNIIDIVNGPYPFLMVKNQSILISFVWFFIVFGLAYLISFILRRLYNKFHGVL